MKYLTSFKLFESVKILGNVQKFNYKIIKTEPIENLEKYKKKRRLSVYYHKGTKCVNYEKCGREGEIITHGLDRGGNVHIDVCTKDYYPMTVDHIQPRSKGGLNTLDNLQPMCYDCNQGKGNAYEGDDIKDYSHTQFYKDEQNRKRKRRHLKGRTKKYDIKVGDIVYKDKSHEYLGKVVDIRPNPHHPKNILAAQIEERIQSLYIVSNLFIE